VPHHWAKVLRKQRTGAISVLFPDLSMGWAQSVMNGIEDVLIPGKYTSSITLYGNWNRDRSPESIKSRINHSKIDIILQKRDEGVICQPNHWGRDGYISLNEQNVPIVFIGSLINDMTGLDNVSSVTWDCGPATKAVVQHLIATGHRKIAFVGGKHQLRQTAVCCQSGSTRRYIRYQRFYCRVYYANVNHIRSAGARGCGFGRYGQLKHNGYKWNYHRKRTPGTDRSSGR